MRNHRRIVVNLRSYALLESDRDWVSRDPANRPIDRRISTFAYKQIRARGSAPAASAPPVWRRGNGRRRCRVEGRVPSRLCLPDIRLLEECRSLRAQLETKSGGAPVEIASLGQVHRNAPATAIYVAKEGRSAPVARTCCTRIPIHDLRVALWNTEAKRVFNA
jgi:hypothetical protein